MNFISYNAAYCLYPRATFEERRTVSMSVSNQGEAEALGKYAVRGWKILHEIWAHEEKNTKSSFYMYHPRWVDDERSWAIPLDLTGVVMRPPPSVTSDAFTWDPVIQNSWKLARNNGGKLLMTYHVAKSTLFRYNYLVADHPFMQKLVTFFMHQGALEGTKRSCLSAEEKRTSATWCVPWPLFFDHELILAIQVGFGAIWFPRDVFCGTCGKKGKGKGKGKEEAYVSELISASS